MEQLRPGAHVRLDVPASSANLGPGFDSLGLGLELRDVVEAEVVGDALQVEVEGEGAGSVPTDERHLVVRSMHTLWERLGVQAPRGLRLRCTNAVPQSRGLGSSAAAIVGGVAAAYALTGRPLDDAGLAVVNDVAGDLEGHPDNSSASVYGGYTVSWHDGDAWRTVRPRLHEQVRAVAYVPDSTLSTDKARAALPEQVPLADAARNAGRAALMTHAMTADPTVLSAATDDRLHQDNRRPAYPQSMALVDRLRADGFAAFVSGAGPTVLVLGTPQDAARLPVASQGWRRTPLEIAQVGVRVM